MNNIIKAFESTTFSEIQSVSLLNRIDTKYLLSTHRLPSLLKALQKNYVIITNNSNHIQPYTTTYFDTPDLFFYHTHHNGKLHRFKFRSREYKHSGDVFHEIKEKLNTGKTLKSRIQRHSTHTTFDTKFYTFAQSKLSTVPKEMLPQLTVQYDRITLVDKNLSERLTIDLDIHFMHKDRHFSFDNLVIVELKQDKGNDTSYSKKALRSLKCRPMGFSKYCIGIATTHTNIKKNNFLHKIRQVNKICKT